MSEKPGCVHVSVPGRTELGGNHTDHEHGHVLAAAVDRRVSGDARLNRTGTLHEGGIINVSSDRFPTFRVKLSELDPSEAEQGQSAALVRGMVAGAIAEGLPVEGFDIHVTSEVPVGGGLSSSAAFEVLVGTAIEALFSEGALVWATGRPAKFAELDAAIAMKLALRATHVERDYFGKPCGAMDQVACAFGGSIAIDFKNPEVPLVSSVPFDFGECGYALCFVDSGVDHAQFTPEYAQIAADMQDVARLLGGKVLRDVSEREFTSRFAEVEKKLGDRKARRALHYFREEGRVSREVAALQAGDFEAFLRQVRESGESSEYNLRNIGMAMGALRGCMKLLQGRGACRIHGGGFGGNLQAWVPNDLLDSFKRSLKEDRGTTVAVCRAGVCGPRVEVCI